MREIFVDLDGVLTDFQKQLAKLLNKPLDRDWNFGNDPKVWKKIDDAGESFWSDMKWMSDGHELWDAVKGYKPTILSSPSRHSSSRAGKKLWLDDNLPKVPYIIAAKKEPYAKKGYILIDDREKNIKKWNDAGGIGILHKDAESTIKKLEEIMSNKKKEASSSVPKVSFDYSSYVHSTPKDGGEYFTLRIPKDTIPPKEGTHLNIGGIDLVVFTVSTPEDIANGRGGPVAQSMIKNGIGWSVNCLPNNHEYVRKNTLPPLVPRMDALASELEAAGLIKEAYFLDKLAGKWEDFLKAEKAAPGSYNPNEQFQKARMKKFLWDSGDKRLQTVKDVLENIVRRRTATNIPQEKLAIFEDILKDLRSVSITEFTDQKEIAAAKKAILNKAFGLDEKISELIALLFAPVENKADRIYNENEINRIAKPYLIQRPKDPFNSDYRGSRMFQEMARRADSLDLSGLSDDHVRVVNACLEMVMANLTSKDAAIELSGYLVNLIDYARKEKRSLSDLMHRIDYGVKMWPLYNVDEKKGYITAWKEAIDKICKSPQEILKLALSFRLNSQDLEVFSMPIKEWSEITKVNEKPLREIIEENFLAVNGQSPKRNNSNPVVIRNGPGSI